MKFVEDCVDPTFRLQDDGQDKGFLIGHVAVSMDDPGQTSQAQDWAELRYLGETDDDGRPHGNGKRVILGRLVDEGQFDHGRFSQGIRRMYNKGQLTATFSGTFKINELTQAVFEYADGSKYDGTVLNYRPQGYGAAMFPRSGNPCLSLVGWFDDGRFKKGTIKYTNGNRYDGSVVDGLPEGPGKMVFYDGQEYDGLWKAGMPEGEGTSTCREDGKLQTIKGIWVKGRANGHVTQIVVEGDETITYIGNMENQVRQGNGKATTVKGDEVSSFDGTWVDDEPHIGKQTDPNGDAYDVEYMV